MIKFTTGTATTAIQLVISENTANTAKKNSENHLKLAKNTKNQVKNYVILHFIKGVPIKNMRMRTAAVQPRILS